MNLPELFSMRQMYLIELEKAKSLRDMTQHILSRSDLSKELTTELNTLSKRYCGDIEHYSIKLRQLETYSN